MFKKSIENLQLIIKEINEFLNQYPNRKFVCLLFKETDNYLIKLTEDDIAERFKKGLRENQIVIDKFVDINTENIFEFFSSNTENFNKEAYMESIFPGDCVDFIQRNILGV